MDEKEELYGLQGKAYWWGCLINGVAIPTFVSSCIVMDVLGPRYKLRRAMWSSRYLVHFQQTLYRVSSKQGFDWKEINLQFSGKSGMETVTQIVQLNGERKSVEGKIKRNISGSFSVMTMFTAFLFFNKYFLYPNLRVIYVCFLNRTFFLTLGPSQWLLAKYYSSI